MNKILIGILLAAFSITCLFEIIKDGVLKPATVVQVGSCSTFYFGFVMTECVIEVKDNNNSVMRRVTQQKVLKGNTVKCGKVTCYVD